MIEINLSPGEHEKDITKIAGFNLSLLNIKLLVPFFILIYAIEPIVNAFYEDNINQIRTNTTKVRQETRKLQSELRKYDEVKDQVKKLNFQQTSLKAKIEIVKKIVDKRQNPYSILKYIADNTPRNVWVNELEIDDVNLKIIGYSKSWKSIGDFIENLKDSIFFNGNVQYKQAEGLGGDFGKNRIETFEISTTIVSFK